MDFLHSVLFGIVEGITEFLPISSTGHLILTAKLLGLEQTNFQKTFEISIQLGAILSVVVLYWKTLSMNREVLKRVITAFIPTAIIGLALYKIIKKVFFASEGLILWSLFLGEYSSSSSSCCILKRERPLKSWKIYRIPHASLSVFFSPLP